MSLHECMCVNDRRAKKGSRYCTMSMYTGEGKNHDSGS